MIRIFFISTAVVILFSSLPVLANPDVKLGDLGYNGGVNSNPHNISSLAVPTRLDQPKSLDETEICVFCHTPHGATPQSSLWNRLDPVRMGSFPLFNSAQTLDPSGVFAIDDPAIQATSKYVANDPGVEYPNGATKLCLSCHDGVTSIGVLADNRVVTMTQDTITEPTLYWDPVTGNGMDFSNSHPVSFVYSNAVVDYINGSTAKADVYKYFNPTTRIKLDNQQRMQCTTCHEPHFDTRSAGHTYPFWRNAGVGADDTEDYDLTCAECHEPRRTFTPHNI